jgi:hypothetical protein
MRAQGVCNQLLIVRNGLCVNKYTAKAQSLPLQHGNKLQQDKQQGQDPQLTVPEAAHDTPQGQDSVPAATEPAPADIDSTSAAGFSGFLLLLTLVLLPRPLNRPGYFHGKMSPAGQAGRGVFLYLGVAVRT